MTNPFRWYFWTRARRLLSFAIVKFHGFQKTGEMRLVDVLVAAFMETIVPSWAFNYAKYARLYSRTNMHFVAFQKCFPSK